MERRQCEFNSPLCAGPGKERVRQDWRAAARLDGRTDRAALYPGLGRVLCLDPDVDTQMFEALEIEIGQRFGPNPLTIPSPSWPCSKDRFPMGSRSRNQGVSGGELFSGLEDLMRLYVDNPRRERKQRRGGGQRSSRPCARTSRRPGCGR